MSHALDEQLSAYHQRFDLDYAEQRDRLMHAVEAHGTDVEGTHPTGSFPLRHPWIPGRVWAAIAAMVLVGASLGLLLHRPAPAWGRVVEQLAQVRSLEVSVRSYISKHPFGAVDDPLPDLFDGDLYHVAYLSDGRYRQDGWDLDDAGRRASAADQPEETVIVTPEAHGGRAVRRDNEDRTLDRELIVGGSLPTLASSLLDRLKRVREEHLRALGERVVDGHEAVGYEAVIDDQHIDALIRSQGSPAQTVQIWVHADSGLPLRMETRAGPDDLGLYHLNVWTNFRWNRALDEATFDPPDPHVWPVRREEWTILWPWHLLDREDVAFTLAIEDGPVLLTGDHLERGEVYTRRERLGTRRTVRFEIDPAARQRFLDASAAHVGRRLIVTFGDDVRHVRPIVAPITRLTIAAWEWVEP